MSINNTEWEFNNLRFLGGQCAKVMPEYVDLAKLDGGMAIALYFLKNRERWKLEKDKDKVRNEKLYYIGQVLKMPIFQEITVLSMMLGDKAEESWDAQSGQKPDRPQRE